MVIADFFFFFSTFLLRVNFRSFVRISFRVFANGYFRFLPFLALGSKNFILVRFFSGLNSEMFLLALGFSPSAFVNDFSPNANMK